jgi:hypothetical protein
VQPTTLDSQPTVAPTFSSNQSVVIVFSIVICNVTSPYTDELSESLTNTIADILSIDTASVVCLNVTTPLSNRRLESQLSVVAQKVKLFIPEILYPGMNVSSITSSIFGTLRAAIRSNQCNNLFHSYLRSAAGMNWTVLPSVVDLLEDYDGNQLPTLMPVTLGDTKSNNVLQESSTTDGQTIIITSVTLSGALLICMLASLAYYWKHSVNSKDSKDVLKRVDDIEHNLEYDSLLNQSGPVFSNPARMEKLKKKVVVDECFQAGLMAAVEEGTVGFAINKS